VGICISGSYLQKWIHKFYNYQFIVFPILTIQTKAFIGKQASEVHSATSYQMMLLSTIYRQEILTREL